MIKSMKKVIGIVLGIALLAGIGYYFYQSNEPSTESRVGAVLPTGMPIDMVGTRVGTTTTGVYFSDGLATTSAIKRIESYVDTVTFTVDAVSATSTAGVAFFKVFGSNDLQCDTATTTTTMDNTVITSEVRWFSINTNLMNLAGSLTIPTASSTYTWSGFSTGSRNSFTLTDVNTRCIKLDVSGIKAIMQIQMLTRSKQGF